VDPRELYATCEKNMQRSAILIARTKVAMCQGAAIRCHSMFVRLRVEANRVKCQVCLEGANTREGDVNRYRNDESGLIPGNYHHACALKVGYNDWDEE
jgi:hypothetical protein